MDFDFFYSPNTKSNAIDVVFSIYFILTHLIINIK
jgi:hypothetical protein